MLKSEQIPMEVQDALNKAHGFIVSPQALAAAINAWPGMSDIPAGEFDGEQYPRIIHLPLTQENNNGTD